MKKIIYIMTITIATFTGSVYASQDANVEQLLKRIQAMESRIAALESRFTFASFISCTKPAILKTGR